MLQAQSVHVKGLTIPMPAQSSLEVAVSLPKVGGRAVRRSLAHPIDLIAEQIVVRQY